MTVQKLLQSVVFAVALMCATTVATAQSAEDDQGGGFWTEVEGQKLLTEVIPVKGANPNELSEVLLNFFATGEESSPFSCFVIDSTRSIVVQSRPEVMKNVRIALRKLDTVGDFISPTETTMLKCTHRRASEIAESVGVQLTNKGKVAVDVARNTIVVRDTPERVQAVRKLVDVLDRPTAQMVVEFHVLGPKGAPLANGGLGESLQRELEEMGLKGYGIVSHTMVRTLEGENFTVAERNAFRQLVIEGQAKVNEERNQASLQFSMSVRQQASDNRGPGGDSSVELQTNLRVPVGDRTIVGIAPTGEDGSRPLALVVRVRVTQ